MAIPSARLASTPAREIDLAYEESGGRHSLPSGDHEAEFDRLYTEFRLRVVGLVRKFIADEDQVDDIVQETFLRAYNAGLHVEYVNDEDDGRSQWPWLAAVARNLSLDNLRKRKATLEDEIDDELLDIGDSLDDPEVRFLASRRHQGIVEALQEMCPRQRRLLILRHVQGVDYVDLARKEGISVDALKSVIARARRSFKQAYASIAEHNGLGVVVGGLVAKSRDRLRTLRDRLLGAPDALNAAAAGSPALTNTVMSLAVLGAVGVAGAVAGSPSESAPEPTPIISELPALTEVAAAPEPVVVTTDAEPATVGVVAPDPEPAPSAEATPEATSDPAPATEAGASVDSKDIVPVDEAPASGGGGATIEKAGGEIHTDQELIVDADGDESVDLGVGNKSGVQCPPPEERSLVGSVVCPVVESDSSSAS